MVDFNSVLDAARQLSLEDRLRLIDALWHSVPPDANFPLQADWAAELERRVAGIQAGMAKTAPWTAIRDEALARLARRDVTNASGAVE